MTPFQSPTTVTRFTGGARRFILRTRMCMAVLRETLPRTARMGGEKVERENSISEGPTLLRARPQLGSWEHWLLRLQRWLLIFPHGPEGQPRRRLQPVFCGLFPDPELHLRAQFNR